MLAMSLLSRNNQLNLSSFVYQRLEPPVCSDSQLLLHQRILHNSPSKPEAINVPHPTHRLITRNVPHTVKHSSKGPQKRLDNFLYVQLFLCTKFSVTFNTLMSFKQYITTEYELNTTGNVRVRIT
jgi:hypothetical protein